MIRKFEVVLNLAATLLLASFYYVLTFSSAMAQQSPKYTYPQGKEYLENIKTEIELNYNVVLVEIGSIEEGKSFSALKLGVDRLKDFRQIDLDGFKNQLLDYCSELEQRDREIVLRVATDPILKRRGPTLQQTEEREVIKRLRAYCATDGSEIVRRREYWLVYSALDGRSLALYNELLRRRDECGQKPRCVNGIDRG